MADFISNTLLSRCPCFTYYSVAVDESTDTTDTAQLAVFIREIDDNFSITEELASLVPLKGTTQSTVLFAAVQEVLETVKLPFTNMSGLTNDGAPAMIEPPWLSG